MRGRASGELVGTRQEARRVSGACAIYQRAVKQQGYSYNKNPGTLDLWSVTYLPDCSLFITRDKRQRRALKILNRSNPRPARILSYA